MPKSYGCPFDIAWPAWGVIVLATIVVAIAVAALLSLRRRAMDETPRFLWALFVVVCPMLGPITYFLVHPGALEEKLRRPI